MRDSVEPLAPGICTGTIRHRRIQPAKHEFVYPIFFTLLDIDRIPSMLEISPFTSYERFNVLSFHSPDHLQPASGDLRAKLAASAAAEGLALPSGSIFLLTNLRYLGYNFNPISLFYCCGVAGEIEMIAADVHSTFGERYTYWLHPGNRDAQGAYRASKRLYVSPFNGLNNDYRFAFSTTRQRLCVHIDTCENSERFFDATLTLDWKPWTRSHLHQALAAFPLHTLGVITAIHWQALQLFFKRVPYVPHPKRTGLR